MSRKHDTMLRRKSTLQVDPCNTAYKDTGRSVTENTHIFLFGLGIIRYNAIYNSIDNANTPKTKKDIL